MINLKNIATKRLQKILQSNELRSYYTSEKISPAEVITQGKKYISFACNDYLGLSSDERLKEAAIDAIRQYGSGAGASRALSGNNILYDKLESLLSYFKSTEASCVFGSGYLANIGVIPALVGRNDLVISDKLIHACLIDGIKISGAKHLRFLHNSTKSLQSLLQKNRRKYGSCLIVVESIYSMDGDISPLQEIIELAEKYDCWVLCDDAHGTYDVKTFHSDILVWMGTLSKSLGTYGGYVTGTHEFIDLIRNVARSLMFSTALPPSILASSIKALEIIKQNPKLSEVPKQKCRKFLEFLELNEKAQSQIYPLIVKDSKKSLELSHQLKEQGFLVPAIRPPTVQKNTARLRFSFSSSHTDQHLFSLAGNIRRFL